MSDDDTRTGAAHNKLLLLRTRPVEDWDLPALFEMMRDCDDGVRDWATFALAARDDDSEDIRHALLERAADPDFDARSEAIWGLARRRDGRAVSLLLRALEGEQVGTLFIEAAAYLAKPELVAPLDALREWWDADPDLLEEAISRCRGQPLQGGRCWDLVPANDRRS